MKRSEIVKMAKTIKSHNEVVKTYNNIKPLPVGYVLKDSDDWCASFISVVFYKCGIKSFLECSVPRMITLAKNGGVYKNRYYTPKAGDVVIYDWDSIKDGDHVGIITEVSGNRLTVLEGNKGGAIGYRKVDIDNDVISGYITPKYDDSVVKKYTTVDDVVNAIIRGEFGNGVDRERNLVDYFQKLVNEKLS